MFRISEDGLIDLSRGDSVSLPLFINQGTEVCPVRYELTEQDTVYFGVCEPGKRFEQAIIRKKYTPDNWKLNKNGDLIISFKPTDTESLEDGVYYYTVKLVTVDEDGEEEVQTIIPLTKMNIEG